MDNTEHMGSTLLFSRRQTVFSPNKAGMVSSKGAKRRGRGIPRRMVVATPSLPESVRMLDDIVRDNSVVSHAIVDFSVFYFGLNWLFYRGVRERVGREQKKNEEHTNDKEEQDKE